MKQSQFEASMEQSLNNDKYPTFLVLWKTVKILQKLSKYQQQCQLQFQLAIETIKRTAIVAFLIIDFVCMNAHLSFIFLQRFHFFALTRQQFQIFIYFCVGEVQLFFKKVSLVRFYAFSSKVLRDRRRATEGSRAREIVCFQKIITLRVCFL